MIVPPPHPDEARRLESLARLGILDTPPEERFDRITRVAAHVLGVPIALVSLIDRDRQWFKSVVGLDGVTETPREVAFCAHAVADTGNDRLVVNDARLDPRFAGNPMVVGDPNIRFYAGQVLHAADGMPVGTLCVIDDIPHDLDDAALDALADLAAMAETELQRISQTELLVRLDESERTKTLILETLHEGLVLFDGQGRVADWNTTAASILGITGDELAQLGVGGAVAWPIVHADETPWSHTDHPVAVTMRTGHEVADQTMGIDRADGSRVWVRLTSRPVFDVRGAPDGALAVFIDITAELEQRVSSAALTERLRAAIDESPLGTGLTDRLGRFTYVNAAYADLLGMPADQAVGSLSTDFVHPDDAATGVEEATALMTGQRDRIDLELRLLDVAGTTKFVHVHATRLNPATTSAAFLIQLEDITARQQLQEALRRSEEVARVSLAALNEGVVLVDANARVHLANPAAEEILGTTAEELSQRWGDGSWTGYDEFGRALELHERPIVRAFTTGEPVHREVYGFDRDDGQRILLELSCIPTEVDSGQPGVLVAFSDVTERRALERQLERYGHLFRHANDIITVIGSDGQVRYASPSNARVLGYHDGFRHPQGILGMVHPDDLPDAAKELAALMAGDRLDEPFTVRVQAASGEWRHIECVGVNLLDEPAVGGVVLTSRDVTDRQRLVEELAHRASHDLLTDLPNRSVLATQLSGALARGARAGNQIALCYLDLDGFKAVNDTLGHAAGDQMLVTVADRIRSVVRTGDTPARVGGDEFVVLLDPVSGADDALAIAHRLRTAVLGDDDLTIGGVRCGVSIGVATSRSDDTPDQLQARADMALYRAKDRGDRSIEIAPA